MLPRRTGHAHENRADGQGRVRRAPAAARLVVLCGAAILAWALRRHTADGGLRGFFAGIGLEQGEGDRKQFKVDNSNLGSSSSGISYRKTKNPEDVVQGEGVAWESIIYAVDEGDGWVKVGPDRYLPIQSKGVTILIPVAVGEEDWKEAAFKRQQERIVEMKRKADPNYKKTPKELLEQQRRKAIWKAMSTRNSERIFDKDFGGSGVTEDGMLVTVALQKPLGINFLEINPSAPCGALIGDLADGYSAKACNQLQVGDVLVFVDGVNVNGKPMDEALKPIVEKQGTVELTFFRAD